MQRKIITTKDNSKTLLISEMNETYHSTHGALTEALHIFIENGIKQFSKNNSPISIFEMGFGTGLNAILTYRFALKNNTSINYTTVEKYPVNSNEINTLNYKQLLNLTNKENEIYTKMHTLEPLRAHQLNKTFSFTSIYNDIKETKLKPNTFNLIYFDAFAPQHQPHLWEENILKKMHLALKPNGFLITYCAQGKFKRTLKAIGFKVEALDGPPGKREITKAIKM